MRVLASSIRWRLLLVYLAIAGLALAGIGVFIYTEAQNLFIGNRAKQLRELVYWAVSNAEPVGGLQANDLMSVANRLPTSPSPDFLFFFFDSDGALIRKPGQEDKSPLEVPSSIPSAASVMREETESRFVVSAPGRQYRRLVSIFPVFDSSGSPQGVIQAEARLDEADLALQKLKFVLFLGLGLSFLAASTLWFVFTKVVLRPLEEMARISRAIATGDLSQRMALPRWHNELWDTALAVNQMLDSIDDSIAKEKQNQENLRRFFADVSHEFRSPLTVLKGYVDVLFQGSKDDQSTLERSLHVMRSTLGRLTQLTNDLLTIVRLESGVGLNLENVDMNRLCEDICEMAHVVGEGREMSFQAGTSTLIQGDAELLKRVLWNLLENAIRHTGPKGRIAVSVTGGEGRCRIIVQDDGEGIPREHLPHIFDRFYRVGQSDRQGTGLGLAIAKSIVEAHGGQIAIESNVGSGTTVVIVLPSRSRPQQSP